MKSFADDACEKIASVATAGALEVSRAAWVFGFYVVARLAEATLASKATRRDPRTTFPGAVMGQQFAHAWAMPLVGQELASRLAISSAGLPPSRLN